MLRGISPHKPTPNHCLWPLIVRHCTVLWLLQMRCAPARTNNCSTPSSWSPARRTRPTTTHAVTTRSARRSWTSCWTGSESYPTCAPDSRVSWCSTRSVAEPAPVSRRCWWNGWAWITARRASWSSPSTRLRRCPPPWSSRTTLYWPRTPRSSTRTVRSWWTTRRFTIYAAETWTSSGQRTPTWTGWSVRSCRPSRRRCGSTAL